jgi:hypothetical protein
VQVTDPLGSGFEPNLARPSGDLTGFTNFEFAISGKWLQTPRCRERTDVLRRRRGRRVPPRGRLRQLILEREKPADLLVQAPNKYALVLNLKWGRRCLVQRYSAPRSTLGLDWPIAGRLCRSPDTR